jgi:hypothetical protein
MPSTEGRDTSALGAMESGAAGGIDFDDRQALPATAPAGRQRDHWRIEQIEFTPIDDRGRRDFGVLLSWEI